jgi:hypothetical protein
MDSEKKFLLEKVIGERIAEVSELKGGSGDAVFLLATLSGKKYVFKSGSRASITSQVEFYQHYSDIPYLPQLIYSDSESSELVIAYISSQQQTSYDKLAIVRQLIESFISNYEKIVARDFGFISKYLNGESFADFLLSQAAESYEYINDIIAPGDLKKVEGLIEAVYTTPVFAQKYLLHGDLGFHNFFYSQNQLLGIIDPDPVVGHPVYDLVYAFCSTPQELSIEKFKDCLLLLKDYYSLEIENAQAYLTIGLFKRISSCRKHHPVDLPAYLEAWKKLAI